MRYITFWGPGGLSSILENRSVRRLYRHIEGLSSASFFSLHLPRVEVKREDELKLTAMLQKDTTYSPLLVGRVKYDLKEPRYVRRGGDQRD